MPGMIVLHATDMRSENRRERGLRAGRRKVFKFRTRGRISGSDQPSTAPSGPRAGNGKFAKNQTCGQDSWVQPAGKQKTTHPSCWSNPRVTRFARVMARPDP